MLDIILFFIIFVLLLYSIIATVGIIKSMKKLEYYESVILDIKNKVDLSYNQMKQVDIRGSFESDDEVGIAFDYLKQIILELNVFLDNKNSEKVDV